MSNYITTEDLKLRVGTDRFNAFCTDDPEHIPLTVIAHAEGLVDGFASVRYEVPMEVTPLLQEWCLNAAEYELYKLSPNSKMPEKIRESYQITLTRLAELATGKITTGANMIPKMYRTAPITVETGPGNGSVIYPEEL